MIQKGNTNMQTTEQLKELLYKNDPVADTAPDTLAAAQDFCEGYKAFLDNGKTEREATAYSEKLLREAGYQPFVPGVKLAPGTKIYTINRNKCHVKQILEGEEEEKKTLR